MIATDGFRVSIWTTNPIEKLFSIENIYGTPPLLTFNENDDLLIYFGGVVSIWDIGTHAQARFREIDSDTSWGGVSNGRWFAFGNLLIDATTLAVNEPFMQTLADQSITEGRITGFDPQSRAVVYLANDSTLYILNLVNGTILETFPDGDATYRLFCSESLHYGAFQLTESAEFLAPYQWLMRVFNDTNLYNWSCTGARRDFSPFEAMLPIPTAHSDDVYFLFNRGEIWGIPPAD